MNSNSKKRKAVSFESGFLITLDPIFQTKREVNALEEKSPLDQMFNIKNHTPQHSKICGFIIQEKENQIPFLSQTFSIEIEMMSSPDLLAIDPWHEGKVILGSNMWPRIHFFTIQLEEGRCLFNKIVVLLNSKNFLN